MKNIQLRRTLQNLVKIPNARQGSFSCKIRGFQAESMDGQLTSSCKHQSQNRHDDSSFPWLFSGRGLSLKLLAFLNTKLFKIQNLMAPRDSILWPCYTWTTAYRGILPHSLMKKLGLN